MAPAGTMAGTVQIVPVPDLGIQVLHFEGRIEAGDLKRIQDLVPKAKSLNPENQELRQAGFEDAAIETVAKVSRAPSPREPAMGLCQGTPLRGEIETRAPGRLDEITGKVADAVAAQFGPSSVENRMSALVVSARR